MTTDELALLPGLREALKWKPNTPQLENAMTYAWESALKSFIGALEKGHPLVAKCHDGQECSQTTTGCWGKCMRQAFAERDASFAVSPQAAQCVCGNPTTLGVVHRTDGPCFHYTEPSHRATTINAAVQAGREESALSGRTGENGKSVLPDGDAAERRVGGRSPDVESAEVLPATAAPSAIEAPGTKTAEFGTMEAMAANKEKVERLYMELLYAVGKKYPDETRHQTALRYIREREKQPSNPMAATDDTNNKPV